MRDLPKYAMLTNSEIVGAKVIQLERPYIIASVYDYNRDDERVQERIEDMVQGRYPIAKVKGYAIFLTTYTSLEPTYDPQLQQTVLNEMAQYFLEDKIAHKPGKFMRSEESGRVQQKIDKFAERRKRERIKRTNE